MTQLELDSCNIVAGKPSAEGSETVTALDSATGQPIGERFTVATPDEVDCSVAEAASVDGRFGREHSLRADFLDEIAAELERAKASLIAIAKQETALPEGRLAGELVRTRSQLSMFADLLREGSWLDVCIESGDPDRKPVPKPDIRRMLVPVGPVAVFGASNFPFAFSVPGGDTASALAAGCPVIVKAHPAHPGTSALAGRCFVAAASRLHISERVFSLLHGGVEVGQRLVMHESLESVAFTGSLRAGRALFDLAASRSRPIPVFAEMGSTNPIFVLPGALNERFDELVDGYVGSLTAGVGQFCTNPGLIFGLGEPFERFLEAVSNKLSEIGPSTMLNPRIRAAYEAGCRDRAKTLGRRGVQSAQDEAGVTPVLFRTTINEFQRHPSLQEELFGPSAVSVSCSSESQLLSGARRLPGQLTATVLAASSDSANANQLIEVLAGKVGRVVYNGFPTGVEVNRAMQHGGPYPATTDSRFTSVGTSAIRRFLRPVAFQDVPQDLLPEALRDGSPLGVPQQIDGRWNSR